MTDQSLNLFLSRGTNANRLLFTPSPPTPASGASHTYFWLETDTDNSYAWNGSAWKQVNNSTAITALTGDVTATGPGSVAATIANNAVTTAKINNSAVTLAKIANAAANSKLVGSGAAGSGSAYVELTLGTNLSMSGTTLNAAGGSTLADGDYGDITVGGTGTTLTIDALAVDTGKIAASAVTLAKIANASANSKLLGSGASGSGAAYAELTLGTSLSMSGTTLNAEQPREVLISEQTPTGTGVCTFNTIAGTYRDIRVVIRGRGTQVATNTQVNITLNNDTSAIYDFQNVRGNNATASAAGSAGGTSFPGANVPAASAPAGAASTAEFIVYNYSGTTLHKDGHGFWTLKQSNAASGLFENPYAFWYRSASAITRVDLTLVSGNWDTGTTISLYGLR